MDTLKIVSKAATFFGVVSVIFTVISAIVTFLLIQLTVTAAPFDYMMYVVLSTIMPYLFAAAASLVVAVALRSAGEETVEETAEEELPPTEPVAEQEN